MESGNFQAVGLGAMVVFGGDLEFRAALPPGVLVFADIHANQVGVGVAQPA